MVEDNKLLTEAEARLIADKFLLSKYYNSKTEFSINELITIDNSPVYQLQGKITMNSRNQLNRFILHKTANDHKLKIEIDAMQGKMLHYEIS